VLRAVGAGPRYVMLLLAAEGLMVTLAGVVLGALACWTLIALAGPWVQSHYGITLNLSAPSPSQWQLLGAVLGAGIAASLVPGWRAYRMSLADGLAPRS
jgi:putative ABC transport system permease protein